jgi:glycosyltransferase involved in cell wall biosynthesis
MNGENIICFAKDWGDDPTSVNHVMRLLARENKVLWLNSISTRTPTFTSSSDWRKIGNKLRSFAKGPRHIENGLDVYTPIVLPFPHSKAATTVNQGILRATLGVLRAQRGMKSFQLWSFFPTAVEYVGKLGESFVVYYITDEWSHFSYLDGKKISAMERELCEKADIVFCTARTLLERKKAYNPETYLASHGVDHAHFAKALRPETRVADEIARLPKPVLGFIGLVQDWVDLELIGKLAEAYRQGSIVIVGKSIVDTSRLAKYGNVHLLGRKPYEDLPTYCKGFDVSLIPFVLNELTRNVNPIKLREYLSAGLPVVSTELPEVAFYRDTCSVARTHDEFLAGVAKELAGDSPAARQKRSDAMKSETWEVKVAELGERIARVREARAGGGTRGRGAGNSRGAQGNESGSSASKSGVIV